MNFDFQNYFVLVIKSIFRSGMCKMNLEDYQNVDYIYCLRYWDENAVQDNCQALEVTETTVNCNLELRQRSSQEILDLADYLWMHHYHNNYLIRKNSSKSFSAKILPLWIELADPNSIFGYLQDKSSDWNDVILMWNKYKMPSNLVELEKFCNDKKWRFTPRWNVHGTEASVTILYDFDKFVYEFLTRAKAQLVIVTIEGKKRYLLKIQSYFVS